MHAAATSPSLETGNGRAHGASSMSPRLIRQPGDAYQYAFGPGVVPVAHVVPGETVIVHTHDCFLGALQREDQRPSAILENQLLNPLTGPIWIDGAEAGDTLVVHIDAIDPARDWAVSCLLPHCGALTATEESPTLQPSLPERVWLYRQTARGSFAWRDRWEVPWAPFFGTIGTAPALETRSSLAPGWHGGNLDVPEIGPGRTLHLPVQVPGALVCVGDAHAAQGQGELGGPALEIEAYGTMRFDLIKGQAIPRPRLTSPEAIMTIGIGRPLEEAARAAYADLVAWLVADYDFERLDAYQLLTQVGELHVGNLINAAYALVASCPRRYLPGGGGVGRPWADQVVRPTATPCPPPATRRTVALPPGERPWYLD
jgi:amidase